MLRLQIVETIEVCREIPMLGFAGLQDLRGSPGDLQRLNKTGALFLLGLVRQLPLDNFQSAARGRRRGRHGQNAQGRTGRGAR
ncbi:hypothetical protein [Sphingobium yanoikuyae]|uniref:hypothetical protein n=1 Tax=Sphingobium yanoikuyae TaxID=13690 RepID=UPI001F491648|nr:hypothetical protein [Sphingobium yanoikuyae]